MSSAAGFNGPVTDRRNLVPGGAPTSHACGVTPLLAGVYPPSPRLGGTGRRDSGRGLPRVVEISTHLPAGQATQT